MRPVRTLTLLLIAGLACSGCAAPERPAPLTQWAEYQVRSDAELAELLAVHPMPKPRPVDGLVCFTPAESDQVVAAIRDLRANTEAARAQRRALQACQTEVRALVQAGRVTEERANMSADAAHREADAARQARVWHTVEMTVLRALVAVLVGLAL